ncbi:hypothetical protein AB0G05_42860 [Nonomuraea wenchangensis]
MAVAALSWTSSRALSAACGHRHGDRDRGRDLGRRWTDEIVALPAAEAPRLDRVAGRARFGAGLLGGGAGLLELLAGGDQVRGGLLQVVVQPADVGVGLVQLTVAFGQGISARQLRGQAAELLGLAGGHGLLVVQPGGEVADLDAEAFGVGACFRVDAVAVFLGRVLGVEGFLLGVQVLALLESCADLGGVGREGADGGVGGIAAGALSAARLASLPHSLQQYWLGRPPLPGSRSGLPGCLDLFPGGCAFGRRQSGRGAGAVLTARLAEVEADLLHGGLMSISTC